MGIGESLPGAKLLECEVDHLHRVLNLRMSGAIPHSRIYLHSVNIKFTEKVLALQEEPCSMELVTFLH